jgi:hypothetical protein
MFSGKCTADIYPLPWRRKQEVPSKFPRRHMPSLFTAVRTSNSLQIFEQQAETLFGPREAVSNGVTVVTAFYTSRFPFCFPNETSTLAPRPEHYCSAHCLCWFI